VVAGAFGDAGGLLLGPLREASRAAVEGPGDRPDVPIVPAQLENEAGAIGAALLAIEAASA
jgi:predicted NBD/HSP70 family sugar kinase